MVETHFNSKTQLVPAPLSEDRGFMQISNRKVVDPEVGGLSRDRESELLNMLETLTA